MPRTVGTSNLTPFDPEPERTFRRRRTFIAQCGNYSDSDHNIGDLFPSNTDSVSEIEMGDETPPPPEPRLTDYSKPSLSVLPKAIMPSIAAETFKIEPALINMIERRQYGGEPGEDPNLHIQSFIQYCSTIKQKGLTPEQTMEILFPFSLSGKAKLWINGLNRAALEITNWESLALAFYVKYFPPEKTACLRGQILGISQQADESLFEVWERFKDLQRECPHHGLEDWFLIQQFYNGLGNESRCLLDSAASGRFMQLEVPRAMEVIEEIAIHNAQYGNPRGFADRGVKHEMNSIE